TVFFLAVDGSVKAVIAIADTVRESSKDAIDQIKSFGITPVMLTGDDNLVAERVAKQVGINHVKSKLSPEDKINEILNYKAKGNVVGMVGDGINDAPALAAADVSFAIGSGTDIAIESAEIILTKGDIAKVAETIRISQQTMKIIKQNLFWAFGYNFIALPIAALGLLNPMIAAGAMALSSISVVTNSLRLKAIKSNLGI
ncbi:MAG: heavy metal translocating P-type ATPase, partial [Candidatus Anammoxibacter sp.]